MLAIISSTAFEACDEQSQASENPLETGFINEGSACRNTGTAWFNTSQGVSYGDGVRFEHEETPFMSKVPGRKDR